MQGTIHLDRVRREQDTVSSVNLVFWSLEPLGNAFLLLSIVKFKGVYLWGCGGMGT